jgi:malate dehydrogenase
MTVWGNHSATQYPDITHARISARPAPEVLDDMTWVESQFIPTVQKRGAAIIDARGASSAASAASAAIDHVRDWVSGTPADDWVSMAIPSDGSYGFPVRCADGAVTIVEGLDIDAFSRSRIDASVNELLEERAAVESLSLLT